MPKRLIDGEALWSSSTLYLLPKADCLPVLIYCWLLPIAEGNGVFEYDVRAIHQKAMSYHDIISEEELEGYLNLFREYGLLFVWEVDGRKLGFWINMNKRLPKPKPTFKFRWPNPPEEDLKSYIRSAKERLCYGVYSEVNPPPEVLGLGLELRNEVEVEDRPKTTSFLHTESGQENIMTIQKQIKRLSLTILGCEAEPWDDVWNRVKDLADAFGSDAVESAFEEWANSKQGEVVQRPVADFLKVATGMLRGIISLKENPELKQLIDNMVFTANDIRVAFTTEQKAAIGRLMPEHTAAEIEATFREYWSKLEESSFAVSRAAHDFTEKAEQLLTLQKRRKTESEALESMKERIIAQEQAAVAQRRSEREAQDAEDAKLSEEGLF